MLTLSYIMQIVNIHKQAELTKNNVQLTVPLFIGESSDRPKDMQRWFLHNISVLKYFIHTRVASLVS